MTSMLDYFGDGKLPWYVNRLRRILNGNGWTEAEFKEDNLDEDHELYVIFADLDGWRLVITTSPRREDRRWNIASVLKDPDRTARAVLLIKDTYGVIRGSLEEIHEIWEKGPKV